MPTTAELESRQLLTAQRASANIATGNESFRPNADGRETWVAAAGTSEAHTLADWMALVSAGLIGGIYSVAGFGAAGDGVTDDTSAFQEAIDALPDAGGIIIVPPGDYSTVNPASLTIPEVTVNTRPQRKMVTWRAYGATLPREMPGMVMRSGQHREYGVDGLDDGRFGDAFMHLRSERHFPKATSQNQQDAVLFAELYVEGDVGGLDHEMEAIKFDATIKDSDAQASVRGIRGAATGDGGTGKVRAVRTASVGQNEHYGVLSGHMAAVYRVGIVPAAFGGDGIEEYAIGSARYGSSIDYAFIGQAGAGARGCFFASGFAGKDTPQTAFAMNYGAQAVLPTVAAVDLHGGGSGQIMRVMNDENASAQIAGIAKDARASFPGFRSSLTALTVADDAVGTVTLLASQNTGFFKFWAPGSSAIYGEMFYRSGTGIEALASIVEGAGVDYASAGTALAGTTGVDGQVTISVKDSTILIENRSSGSQTFHWLIMAG